MNRNKGLKPKKTNVGKNLNWDVAWDAGFTPTFKFHAKSIQQSELDLTYPQNGYESITLDCWFGSLWVEYIGKNYSKV